ncbi:MAG: zinc ribbon domain-containing protein [Clostridiales bacterium]|nr:zinc ribbon domain-containing protein [Clostridiales bacterium]
MAFLDNLGKKVSEAAQAAAKKSGELVEITKTNININGEEDKIEKKQQQMGKLVYEKFQATGSIDEEFAGLCNEITAHMETVKNLRQKIMEIKNIKSCTGCGAELERTAMFCAKCGTRQEVPEASSVPFQAAPSQLCPACGAAVPPGTAFCTACGAKVS